MNEREEQEIFRSRAPHEVSLPEGASVAVSRAGTAPSGEARSFADVRVPIDGDRRLGDSQRRVRLPDEAAPAAEDADGAASPVAQPGRPRGSAPDPQGGGAGRPAAGEASPDPMRAGRLPPALLARVERLRQSTAAVNEALGALEARLEEGGQDG